jgi:hypothetical protein
MELNGGTDIFATPEGGAVFIDTLPTEQFGPLLITMNGLLLNLPKDRRGFATGLQIQSSDGINIDNIHPAPQDKEQLVELLAVCTKHMQTPQEKALLLSVGLNTIHPFMEGNGRVARSIYHILTQGFRSGDTRLHALQSDKGEELLRPNPAPLRDSLMATMQMRYGTHEYDAESHAMNPKIGIIGRKLGGLMMGRINVRPDKPLSMDEQVLMGVFSDKHLASMVPALAIMSGEEPSMQKHVKSIRGQDVFDFDSFTRNPTASQIEAVRAIYRDIKFAYAKHVFSAFVKPSDYLANVRTESGRIKTMPMVNVLHAITNCLVDIRDIVFPD